MRGVSLQMICSGTPNAAQVVCYCKKGKKLASGPIALPVHLRDNVD